MTINENLQDQKEIKTILQFKCAGCIKKLATGSFFGEESDEAEEEKTDPKSDPLSDSLQDKNKLSKSEKSL